MAPGRTLVVPWCVGMFLRLRIGLGVRRTWRKLEKTCSTFKLQCRKGDTIQDLWELEFFISCAFLGIRIPSSMWEQRCGNRQGSKAAVYSRYNKKLTKPNSTTKHSRPSRLCEQKLLGSAGYLLARNLCCAGDPQDT